LQAGGRLSCRPRLEPLEDRMMPALTGGLLAIHPLLSVASPAAASTRSGSPTPICVTVAENSPATVIDLSAVYASVSGLQHDDGLKFSVLGNTNPGLVKTNLSEATLTLTYAQGKSGTATITVCATDADGVSVKRTILVTVRPLNPAAVVSVSPPPPGRLVSPPTGTLP
jgi:hypothetical protein